MQVLNKEFHGNPSCSLIYVIRRTNITMVRGPFRDYVHAPKMCNNKNLDKPIRQYTATSPDNNTSYW